MFLSQSGHIIQRSWQSQGASGTSKEKHKSTKVSWEWQANRVLAAGRYHKWNHDRWHVLYPHSRKTQAMDPATMIHSRKCGKRLKHQAN